MWRQRKLIPRASASGSRSALSTIISAMALIASTHSGLYHIGERGSLPPSAPAPASWPWGRPMSTRAAPSLPTVVTLRHAWLRFAASVAPPASARCPSRSGDIRQDPRSPPSLRGWRSAVPFFAEVVASAFHSLPDVNLHTLRARLLLPRLSRLSRLPRLCFDQRRVVS
jgi:hypothetical protein